MDRRGWLRSMGGLGKRDRGGGLDGTGGLGIETGGSGGWGVSVRCGWLTCRLAGFGHRRSGYPWPRRFGRRRAASVA